MRLALTSVAALILCLWNAPGVLAQTGLEYHIWPDHLRPGDRTHIYAVTYSPNPGDPPAVRVYMSSVALDIGEVELADDGVSDDGIAGNDVWGADFVIGPAAVTPTLGATPTVRGETASGQLVTSAVAQLVIVLGCDTWHEERDITQWDGDSGDLPEQAARVTPQCGGGAGGVLRELRGRLRLRPGDVVDMFRVRLCGDAPASVTITNENYYMADLQLFVFDAEGRGVVFNDNRSAEVSPLFVNRNPTIEWTGLTPGTEYLVAMSLKDLDPMNNGLREIWSDTFTTGSWAPNGVGRTNPLVQRWAGTSPAGFSIEYVITSTGLCFLDGCDDIDFNNNGIWPETEDLLEYLGLLSGGECSTGVCGDLDFNNDGISPDGEDLGAFLRVFGGGAC